MNIVEDIRSCIAGKIPKMLPVLPSCHVFNPRVFGISYERLVTNGEMLAQCEIAMVKEFDFDWAFFPMDSAVALEPLGVEAGPKQGGKGTIPWTPATELPATERTLRTLTIPDPHSDGRLPLRLQALSRARAEFGDSKCITGFMVAPFSSVCYLYGAASALMLLLDDPKLFLRTVEFFVNYQIADGLAQIEAGAHAILIADLFAASNFVSPIDFERFSLPSLKKLIRVFNQHETIVFYHPNEHLVSHLKKMSSVTTAGGSALTVGTSGDAISAKQALVRKICLMGSFDPVSILRDASSVVIAQKTKELIDEAGRLGGFMIYSGGTVAVDTPEENVRTLVDTAREYWR